MNLVDPDKIIIVDKDDDVDDVLKWATGLDDAGIRAVFKASTSADDAFERFARLAAARGCTMCLLPPPTGEN